MSDFVLMKNALFQKKFTAWVYFTQFHGQHNDRLEKKMVMRMERHS